MGQALGQYMKSSTRAWVATDVLPWAPSSRTSVRLFQNFMHLPLYILNLWRVIFLQHDGIIESAQAATFSAVLVFFLSVYRELKEKKKSLVTNKKKFLFEKLRDSVKQRKGDTPHTDHQTKLRFICQPHRYAEPKCEVSPNNARPSFRIRTVQEYVIYTDGWWSEILHFFERISLIAPIGRTVCRKQMVRARPSGSSRGGADWKMLPFSLSLFISFVLLSRGTAYY